MDLVYVLFIVAIFALPRMLLLLIPRIPKPLKDLVCVVTGGAGEIGQVVSLRWHVFPIIGYFNQLSFILRI